MVALHDRSAERRAERELEAVAADLQATLESTADGILVTDLAGHIRSFNQRFAQLWEVPHELLRQRDDDAVLEWMLRSVADPARLHAAPRRARRTATCAGHATCCGCARAR